MMTILHSTGSVHEKELAVTMALDARARGGRRMILAALEAEVEAYLAHHRVARDERGHAVVVRNGHARPRRVTVGAGTVPDPGAARQ